MSHSGSSDLVVEIQFGEGGDDSKLFVAELFAAYCKYAESKNLQVTLLSSSKGHVLARFEGSGAWEAFRHESGKHCVQRCPPTERRGRRHTSIVSVALLPTRKEVEVKSLPSSELLIKTQGGRGPGGQHQNKTDSAVRATHLPTGLQVLINGRDQHQNRREALRILAAKVHEHHRAQREKDYGRARKSQMGSGGRGDKIRTYNFIDSRVVDHRLKKKTSKIKQVMNGDFGLLLD